MNFNRIKKVVVVYDKRSHKIVSALNFLRAKLGRSERLVKDVQNKCTQLSADLKAVKNECKKMSRRMPNERQKAWWRDADAVTHIALCAGLVLCTIILSCSMKVGALKDLSDKAESAVTKCHDISNSLGCVIQKMNEANNVIRQFHESSINELKNVNDIISSLSNKVEQINLRLDDLGRKVSNGTD